MIVLMSSETMQTGEFFSPGQLKCSRVGLMKILPADIENNFNTSLGNIHWMLSLKTANITVKCFRQ
jgi:hypothetical protein